MLQLDTRPYAVKTRNGFYHMMSLLTTPIQGMERVTLQFTLHDTTLSLLGIALVIPVTILFCPRFFLLITVFMAFMFSIYYNLLILRVAFVTLFFL